jgi:hypothetical protein
MAKKDPKKPKGKGKTPAAAPAAGAADDDVAARRRVALLRHKLTKAMDDPLMRDQIVKAIRAMINDGK